MAISYAECSVCSAALLGVNAIPVSVEVVVSSGMPKFSIVGMTDVAIQEARERVRAALRGCGFSMPGDKVIVNLAPGYLKKSGSGFDLPIAAGLLAATKQIPPEAVEGHMLVGELSLEGRVRSVRGMIAYQELSRRVGMNLVCGPMVAYGGAEAQKHIHVAESLQSLRTFDFSCPSSPDEVPDPYRGIDFKDVGGHEDVKRALQIAAAGSHGILMMGPPGSGKTMLASRLPSILPPLAEDEMLETAKIHSIVGEDTSALLAGMRPFRAPHHSATAAGLAGGGSPVRPGELSLAHHGVVFLDELSEFKPSVLQVMRKPMEDGEVVITRAEGNVVLPAKFMLVSASNPCPCGYLGDDAHECTCSAQQIASYQNRIGGPLIDRMDMCLDVWRSDFDDVVKRDGDVDSATLREGVMRAREFSSWRSSHRETSGRPRSTKAVIASCHMDSRTLSFLESAAKAGAMSGRGICSTLKVARTIADISEQERVTREHVAEALNLRLRNGR